MSFPLTPPPISDKGAWSIPRMLQRWLDINPIGKLTRTETFITLPSFSVDVTWQGYSDIVASFNFEGPNNFSLTGFNIKPSPTPNYLLCVMWKTISGQVYRYKLWSGVGEAVYENIPLYSGQKIGKNFRFEIWSTNSTPAVQSTAITIGTSKLGQLDYRWGQDGALVNSDGQNGLFFNINSNISLPGNPAYRWNPNTNIVLSGQSLVSWRDSISNLILHPTNAVIVDTVSGQLGIPGNVISPTSNTSYVSTAGLGINPGTVAFGICLEGATATATIYNNGNGISFGYDKPTNKFTAYLDAVSNITLTQGVWYLIVLYPAYGLVYVFNMKTGVVLDTFFGSSNANPDTTITIGNTQIFLGEFVVYPNELDFTDQLAQLVSYFVLTYFSGFTLPLTFPPTSVPQSN